MKRLIILAVLLFTGQAWAGDYDSALDAYHQCLSNCKGTIMGRTHCVSKCVDLLPTAPLDRTGAQTDPCAKWNIPKSIVALEDREQFIREWAASGEICRVLGHSWKDASEWFRFDTYDSKFLLWDQQKRKCSICGKTETKAEEWK